MRFVPFACGCLCAAVAAISSGCFSEGGRVEPKFPEALESAKLLEGKKYFIASLRYVSSDKMTPSAGDFFLTDIDPFNYKKDPAGNAPDKLEKLRSALQELCRERFPGRFAADGEQAIPVEVSIKAYQGEQQMIGPMICGFTLGVLPGPYSVEHVYEVSAGPCQPMGSPIAPASPFKRASYTQAGWAALFPTGLIPYFWSSTDESPICGSLSNLAPLLKQLNSKTLALLADASAMRIAERKAELAAIPESVAGPGSIVYGSPLPFSKGPAPGGGIVAPSQDHNGQTGALNGL